MRRALGINANHFAISLGKRCIGRGNPPKEITNSLRPVRMRCRGISDGQFRLTGRVGRKIRCCVIDYFSPQEKEQWI